MGNEIVRASRKTWFSGSGSALYFMCLAIFFLLMGGYISVIGIISLMMALFLVISSVRKIRKYFISFTADSLSGFVDHAFQFSRNDIQAIWFTGTNYFRSLYIIENNIGHEIRCNMFDFSQLDKTLRKYYSPDIYSEYAYLQIPLIREWFDGEKRKIKKIDRVLTVKIRGMYFIPSMLIITFCVLTIIMMSAVKSIINFGWIIPFVLLLIFGLVLLIIPLDTLFVTNDSIRLRHFFKETELRWNALTKISKTEIGYRVVFHGITTKISIPFSDNWFGKDKQLISEIIEVNCKDLKIPIEE
jgi:hypothetical protein